MSVRIARGAMIAALYAITTVILKPISFGYIQVRVADALALLPIIYPEAIPGLFIGCLVSNFFGGLGPLDIILGSLTTLLAAYLTYLLRSTPWAYLPPVVLNGLIVGTYLGYLLHVPYWTSIFFVTLGEAVAVLGLGVPLIKYLQRIGIRG
ncbi:MAG TPA: QueT transporter family protein [Moorella mulderi]|nr:QueT transporter family protein [Moorella mulderi]